MCPLRVLLCPLRVLLLCPFRVLLLWALLCPGTGKFQKEIFTRPGSDLLLPIRLHLTLHRTDTERCDDIYWYYTDPTTEIYTIIFTHWGCRLEKYEDKLFSNMRISENGSLIISNVTLENDGIYSVVIENSTGHRIQTDYYTVHVEGNVREEIFTRPGSDLLLPIRRHLTLNRTDTERCDGISWYYKDPTRDIDTTIFLYSGCTLRIYEDKRFSNTRISENGSLIISNVNLENDGIYGVVIENSTGHRIQRYYYTVHVEGKFQEIFTRPGSDLLIPIRLHLTLNHPDTGRCDEISWKYKGPTRHYYTTILTHWGCTLRKSENKLSPNTRLSENGSLIISNVTPENDGIYRVQIWNSIEYYIQRYYYIVHVEAIVESPGPWNITCTVENGVSGSEESRAGVTCPVSLSDITVSSSCLPDGRTVAVCLVKGSDPHYSWSLDGRSVSSDSWITLPPPISGTLHCDVTNQINNLSRSINISCAESRSGMWPGWGHLLSHSVMCVLNTALLIYIVTELRKMKNEKNRSERRTSSGDPTEMKKEPTYSN